MNREPAPIDADRPGKSRAWIAWILLAGVAVAIGASFLLESDEAPATKQTGAKSTPVVAAEVSRAPMTVRGHYPGELDADSADVAAFYTGRLLTMRVRVGDTVKQGDVIATLDPIDAQEQIAQARAQVKAAAAERTRATVDRDQAIAEVERLEPLARDQAISALEFSRQRARASSLGAAVESAAASEAEAQARVRLLGRRVTESAVRAPFGGRVADRFVDPGTTVSAGTRLLRIVQVTPLRIRFEVPESDVPRLAVGTQLTVNTQAGDTIKAITARVTGIGSEVSRERRVAIVEGLVENPPASWLPGMFAEAVVELRTIEQAITVPSTAVLSRLQPDGKVSTGVFLAMPGDTARWVPLKEVAREGERVAVEAELPPGSRVLVAGHIDLSDGSRITTK